MYVFRDGRRRVAGRELVSALTASLRQFAAAATGDEVIPALIRAGELESALADSGDASPQSLAAAGAALEAIADALVSKQPILDRDRVIASLAAAEVPDLLFTSPLEGFAYYALHPMTYAALAASLPASGPVGVVGIRSIGCALSAVALAALRARGIFARRTTVRPTGHPFDRETELSEDQRDWLVSFRHSSAQFLICDEGPGLSGSSMLATGEALLEAGFKPHQIAFLCSRHADPESLCAHDAARRWRCFRVLVAGPPPVPPDAAHWIGGGAWRDHPLVNGRSSTDALPVWTAMERSKFISRDGRMLYKFEGYGHYGERVRHNAQIMTEHGFAPRLFEDSADLGFAAYEFVPARRATAANISQALLLRFAEYCAFRQRHFAASDLSGLSDPEMTIARMCAVNARSLFGREVDLGPHLPLERPVVSDSRMLPHEWLLTDKGQLLKADGASHGDDHFFPGPCDIAWDLAGVMVEWKLSQPAREYLCEQYRRLADDDAALRLPGYMLAYTLFRAGYCKMAAESLAGSPEQTGLAAAHAHHSSLAARQLKSWESAKAA